MMTQNNGNADETWDKFQQEIVPELEQSNRALKEITLMLEQSQADLNKLAQRNAAITVHLQQVQSQIETLPRGDIRSAYDAALDSQQRLFMMRGQLEKLQSDQAHLQRFIVMLGKCQSITGGSKHTSTERSEASSTSLEMLISAQEAERQRLSRQMHDGPAQALSNFILQTEIAMRLFDIDQTRAKDELTSLKASAMNTFQKVRSFIFELRPMMLDDLGLVPTIKRYVDTFKEQTGAEATLEVTGGDFRLESYLEIMVFRALQEIMGNAVRYNQAAQLKVAMSIDEAAVRVTVEDNGKGGNPDDSASGDGLGMKLIKERVEMLGGRCEIDEVSGKGGRFFFQIPLSSNSIKSTPAVKKPAAF